MIRGKKTSHVGTQQAAALSFPSILEKHIIYGDLMLKKNKHRMNIFPKENNNIIMNADLMLSDHCGGEKKNPSRRAAVRPPHIY